MSKIDEVLKALEGLSAEHTSELESLGGQLSAAREELVSQVNRANDLEGELSGLRAMLAQPKVDEVPGPIVSQARPVVKVAQSAPVAMMKNGARLVGKAGAMALLLMLPFFGMSCANTQAGDALDKAVGIHYVVNPDGSKTVAKDPTSPIQDLGGMFGPIGVLGSGAFASIIYLARQLSNSVPAGTHDKALDQNKVTTTGPADPGPKA